jgi:hypothetical protein
MPCGKGGYAFLLLDGRPEQPDNVAILENARVSSEITLGKQFSTPRHQ